LKKDELSDCDSETTRFIEALRATASIARSNGLVITFGKCMEISTLVRKISAEEVRKEDLDLMRDLAAECDSFLTRKLQDLKDKGVLDFLPIVPGSVEQIRRNMRIVLSKNRVTLCL